MSAAPHQEELLFGLVQSVAYWLGIVVAILAVLLGACCSLSFGAGVAVGVSHEALR